MVADKFRFIETVQTTARQLVVCSALCRQLGNKQLPKRILEEMLTQWSIKEETENSYYSVSKGKITNNGRKTAALRYYYSLCESLGLVKSLNSVYINTNVSYLLLHFLNELPTAKFEGLSDTECVFYLFQLLRHDADGILLCLDTVKCAGSISQIQFQKQFKEIFNQRLNLKTNVTAVRERSDVLNKIRTVNYVWKNPEVYAEHIIAPRLEWLSSLGLVDIERNGRSTNYKPTLLAELFTAMLPKIDSEQLHTDINENWLSEYFFTACSKIFPKPTIRYFFELSSEDQRSFLGNALENATKYVRSSISFRLPLQQTYLFICLELFLNQNIIINFKDIETALNNPFLFNLKTYNQKVSGRATESYITITLRK